MGGKRGPELDIAEPVKSTNKGLMEAEKVTTGVTFKTWNSRHSMGGMLAGPLQLCHVLLL